MQASLFATEWVYDDDGSHDQFIGLMLGYSNHEQHSAGVSPLLNQLGVPESLTKISDACSTLVPNELMLQELVLPRADRRHKERPALLLTMVDAPRMPLLSKDAVERARALGVLCVVPKGSRDPEQLLCSWDQRGFAVCAVGEENVAKLQVLHQGFLDKNICVVRPFVQGITQGSLGFCLHDRFAPALKEATKYMRSSRSKDTRRAAAMA